MTWIYIRNRVHSFYQSVMLEVKSYSKFLFTIYFNHLVLGREAVYTLFLFLTEIQSQRLKNKTQFCFVWLSKIIPTYLQNWFWESLSSPHHSPLDKHILFKICSSIPSSLHCFLKTFWFALVWFTHLPFPEKCVCVCVTTPPINWQILPRTEAFFSREVI